MPQRALRGQGAALCVVRGAAARHHVSLKGISLGADAGIVPSAERGKLGGARGDAGAAAVPPHEAGP